jgi:hypothetical protein
MPALLFLIIFASLLADPPYQNQSGNIGCYRQRSACHAAIDI